MTSKFPETHRLLMQEGHLISSCLSAGLTSLARAGTHDKGAFYSALFNLSIGLERLCKSMIIIERMLTSNLVAPSEAEMRRLGHNLLKLYDEICAISISRNMPLKGFGELDSITQSVIRLLNDFSKSSRYHNLDTLASGGGGKDPLAEWNKILGEIVSTDIPSHILSKKRGEIRSAIAPYKDIFFVIGTGLDGSSLSYNEAFELPAIHELAVKRAVLRLVTFFVSLRGVISKQCGDVYGLGLSSPPIPQMQEFLEWLWDDRSYVLRKKKWP